MDTLKNRNIRILQMEYRYSLYLALFGFVMKTLQILIFFDKDTGLIQNTFLSDAFSFSSTVAFWLLIVLNIKVTFEISPVVLKLKPQNNILSGYSFFLAGVFFFLQGICFINRDIQNYHKNVELFLTQTAEDKLTFMQKLSEMFPVIVDVLAIISAVCFVILGIVYVVDYPKANFTYLLIPVIWGAASLISILLLLSSLVSMISNGVKIGFAVFVLLFLYYITSFLSCYEKQERRYLSVFVRISYPTVYLIWGLPYFIGFLFGKKDLIDVIPHLCYFGLFLFSIPFCLEYYFQTMRYIMKKDI